MTSHHHSPRKAESLLGCFLLVSKISLKDGKGHHPVKHERTNGTIASGALLLLVDISTKQGTRIHHTREMANLQMMSRFQEGNKETSEDFLGDLLRLDTFSSKISGSAAVRCRTKWFHVQILSNSPFLCTHPLCCREALSFVIEHMQDMENG